jgi:hypothetical protein
MSRIACLCCKNVQSGAIFCKHDMILSWEIGDRTLIWLRSWSRESLRTDVSPVGSIVWRTRRSLFCHRRGPDGEPDDRDDSIY